MSEVTKHEPGTFCWPELSTTDQAGAKKFYTGLFGWGSTDQPMGPDSVYTMFTLNGKELGAAASMEPGVRAQGVPPHWLSYIAVANVDQTLEKAKSLGGNVLAGPFDVFDAGRMAVVQDPTGAVFGLWQGNKHIGARVIDETASLVWTELMTKNADKARDFYTKLIGWAADIMDMGPMKYTVYKRGETPAGGMMEITPDMGGVPSHWMPYFGVDDCDGMAKKAEGLGASTLVPPSDVPGVGRFSVLQDPQGAAFSIIKFAPRQ
jgi:uncharacterized protein